MNFNIYKLIKYHLYLLQLENYELTRYWKLLFRRGWLPTKTQRKSLVWTKKAGALVGLAIILHALVSLVLFVKLSWVLGLIVLLGLFLVYPILFSIALLAIWPVDFFVKKILILRARAKISSLHTLKVIGIAGSYGKTTMKEALKEVLGVWFKVQATPESVNTPVGIARWILNVVKPDDEILIVEMGEHYKGDVKELCKLARSDISVVTGINEAHLERMKTLDNIVATIFEIVSASKPKSLVMLNGDDEKVMKHYKEFVWPDHRVEKFQSSNFKLQTFDTEKLVWKVKSESLGYIEINLLGEYALGDVDAAIKIGQSLGMNAGEIKQGINHVKPIEHRLQPVRGAGNVLIIDDAYNGNPAGAAEAIKVLSRFEGRRKLYITPGLVETGKAASDIHREIGKQLANVVDVVILIRNSVTPWIAEGIKSSSGNKPQIIWFDTAQEAHSSLGKILKPNDAILFQNDWGDNYL